MTTAVSETLTREQQVQSLEDYVPKALLTSLGGVDNVLRTIPQNNNFSHPKKFMNLSHRIGCQGNRTYQEIDAQHNTELSISKDFVIFVVRRQIEDYPNPQGFEEMPVSLIAFSLGSQSIYGPYYPVDHQNKFWPLISRDAAIKLLTNEDASITETPLQISELASRYVSCKNSI